MFNFGCSGASIKAIKDIVGEKINVVRAMPNTAIAIGESIDMSCRTNKTDHSLSIAKKIFDSVGRTLVIEERLMIPATAFVPAASLFF